MGAFCDASFLLAVALKDRHDRAAMRAFRAHATALCTSGLAVFEASNRLRGMRHSGDLSGEDATKAHANLLALLRGPIISARPPAWRLLLPEAERLVTHSSPSLPHKTMDVLHVATAALARATDFLTFDKNQRALALAAGLTCPVA